MRRDSTVAWGLIYSASSVAMLITNKLALTQFSEPALLTCFQLISAAVISSAFVAAEGFRVQNRRVILLYGFEASCFTLGLVANMRALLYTSVGAVIAVRSCLPIFVSIVEMLSGTYPLPSVRSVLALAFVALCAYGYAATDLTIVVSNPKGIFWLVVYVSVLTFQIMYGKWLITAVSISHWERVLFTNALGIPGLIFVATRNHDLQFSEAWYHALESWELISVTCVLGVCISYASWRVRSIIAASTFSMIGVVSKMLTAVLSSFIWHTNSSTLGIVFLFGCIGAASFFERGKTRK